MQNSLIKQNFKSVISLVDKLRDISLESYIQLPKIVAVGSQSSGKSSLIQQIVGLDFLPRGSGVVTRRPLQIRMQFQQGLKQSYAIFQEIPNQKFTDFNKVKAAIQEVTDKVCGKNKNIVDKAIVLNVYSQNCPNLTVIDLPGLTRISLGSQVANIHEVTKGMIKKYIEQQNTIILCVISANQDITNDEVLDMARKIDTMGERTIGCITKIDIMDRGTDARLLLMNKGEVPLKMGYVGIKNRSQEDINQNKTVKQSLQQQKNFFSKSPIYSSLPPAVMGTSSLVQKMTKVLQHCILNYIPTLVEKIREKKAVLSEKIKQYGRPLPQTMGQRQSLIWQICNQFILNYKNSLKCIPSTFPSAERIQKVSFHIQESLQGLLSQQIQFKFDQILQDTKIDFALRKYDNINGLGIPSLNCFLFLLTPILNNLKFPMESALNNLCDNLTHLIELIAEEVAYEYREFKQFLITKCNQIVNSFKRKANKYLLDMLECEIKGVIYQKLDFDRFNHKKKLTELEIRNPLIPILRQSVEKYHQRTVRNLRELVPKNFHFLILSQATKKIEFEIFQSCVDSEEKIQKWLQLTSYSVQQRIKTEKQFEVIQKAQQYLVTYSGFSKAPTLKKNKKRQQRQREMEEVAALQRQKRLQKEQKQETQKKLLQSSIYSKKSLPNSQTKTQVTINSNKQSKPEPTKIQIKPEQTKATHLNPTTHHHKSPEHRGAYIKKQQRPIEKPTEKPIQSPSQKSKVPPEKANMFAQLFGAAGKKQQKPGQTVKQATQTPTSNSARKPIFPNEAQVDQNLKQKYNNQMGKTTDKAVDEVFKNQKFQQQSKKAVEKGATVAVQKQLGVTEDTAKLFGQGAGWLWSNDKTQNIVKDQAKKEARDKTQF